MAVCYLTGFEWPGVSTIVATGTGLCATVSAAAPTVEAGSARSGSYGMRCNTTGAAKNITLTVGTGVCSGRFYFRMDSLPSANSTILIFGNSGQQVWALIGTSGQLTIDGSGAGSTITVTGLSTSTWYRLDFQADVSTTTHTLAVWLDGGFLGTMTDTGMTADTDTTVAIGNVSATTFDISFDDLILDDTASAGPFGEGQVLAYVPSGAANHQSITTTQWQTTPDFSVFTNFTGSTESTSAGYLDDLGGTDGIRMNAGAGGQAGNARWSKALLSGTNPGTNPHAVRGIVAHEDATNGANNGTYRIELSGSTSNIYAGEVSNALEYKGGIITTAPGGAAWTNTNLDSVNLEIDSTDTNPAVWVYGMVLEVSFPDAETPPKALTYLTGFEWPGVSTIVATGTGLCAAVNGSPAVEAGSARSGSYGMRCNASGSQTQIQLTVTATATIVMRFYLKMANLPSGSGSNVFLLLTGSDQMAFGVTNTGVTQVKVGPTPTTGNGPTLSTGTWYRFDFRLNGMSGTSWSIDWAVDGAEQTQVSATASGANTDTTLAFGVNSNVTWDISIDDVALSETSGDYPIGEGMVLAYVPSGAANHQSITTTEWQTNSDGFTTTFTNFTGSTESTSSALLDDLTAGTDGIRMNAGASGQAGNARWPIAILSGTNPGTQPQAIRGIAVHQDASSGANAIEERIELSGNTKTIFSGDPAASWEYKGGIFTLAPGATRWTNADLSSLNIEVDSSDTSPAVYLGGVVLEVSFAMEPPPSLVTARRI